MDKKIGVIGLGLIGGSMVKAIKKHTKYQVYAYNRTESVVDKAIEDGNVDIKMTEENMKECDYIIVSLYPDATIEFVEKNIKNFKKNAVIVDCSGTKEKICTALSPLARQNSLYFVGGHPMAGIERSGYANSFAEMYEGATMILCKDEYTNLIALKALELLFLEIGFGRCTVTDYKEHDKNIAFTSQLAHVVSNAYIKSPTAEKQFGFSAGSYKDLTRVARLNEGMWTELFLENRDNLLYETNVIIESLKEYADALENRDAEKLCKLLKDGREAKERIG